ncbi:MAG: ATP-dependent zinc metalloprotease FtsH [Firmicutes bacterium]|nr:ATP-dependent zinc metalloprotease FtsH [Bacillota bacterium]
MGSDSEADTVKEVEFSEFVNYLKNEELTELRTSESGRSYSATLKNGGKIISYAPTGYDMAILSEDYIIPQSAAGTLKVESIRPSAWSSILSWLPTILILVFMVVMWFNLMGSAGGNKGVMNFGKSKARMIKPEDRKVTFADVAGLEEEKTELAEIVDFLKDPKKYTELGARIPKGVLLVGPPGTGKTYISKAVAGEAGVPFFSISGSDFVEMFVGVGASRVRDLFDDAKKNAPCIVFIDEIDAVGRRRGAGIGGGNDEREQTLNQLLVEMDGFGTNEGIIVIAATNRPDVLDPAILRPGRFDRQVTISTPDVKGREEVFKVHSKGKPLGDDVDLKTLAKRTPGFTPADIENMMNEAALLTARRNGGKIHMDDIEEAITRVIAGPKKTSRVITEEENRLTAFHEAGHAVVTRAIPGQDPVHQVTIMPRGLAGGFTLSLPETDRYYMTRRKMLEEIRILLGGRVSEALYLDDISTGASNDLERATKLAHDMVAKYGMSENIGPINYSDSDEVFLGRDFTSKQNFSEELAAKIDNEVRRIIDQAYKETETILKEHEAEVRRITDALLKFETLDGEQFEALYTGTKTLENIEAENKEEEAKRTQANKLEAEERARRKAEELRQLEEDLRNGKLEGKRVAVVDANGRIILKDVPPANHIRRLEEIVNKAEKEAGYSEAPDGDKAPEAEEPEAPAAPETAEPEEPVGENGGETKNDENV